MHFLTFDTALLPEEEVEVLIVGKRYRGAHLCVGSL